MFSYDIDKLLKLDVSVPVVQREQRQRVDTSGTQVFFAHVPLKERSSS
jgi:hypothetical protein